MTTDTTTHGDGGSRDPDTAPTSHEHGTSGAEHATHEHGWSDKKYIQLAVVLAIITALEVYASYADWLGPAFIPSLIIMMIIKFAAVVLFFMHLKFDSQIFGWLFYAGLGLAIFVYVGMLLTFHFFVS
jgi:cytochrome c oxidase subunit IV